MLWGLSKSISVKTIENISWHTVSMSSVISRKTQRQTPDIAAPRIQCLGPAFPYIPFTYHHLGIPHLHPTQPFMNPGSPPSPRPGQKNKNWPKKHQDVLGLWWRWPVTLLSEMLNVSEASAFGLFPGFCSSLGIKWVNMWIKGPPETGSFMKEGGEGLPQDGTNSIFHSKVQKLLMA